MSKSYGGPPREKAIRVLTRVLSDQCTLDDSLEEIAQGESAEARAWLVDVCSGALRWKGRIDLMIDSLALKKKPTGWLRKALVIASAQILLQDRVSPGLVVSETVDLVKRMEGEFPAKFTNALLRKVVEGKVAWATLSFPKNGSAAEKASWASLPEWIWKRMVADQGEAWASGFAQASLERPSAWIRAQSESWKPSGAEPGQIPLSWKLIEGGNVTTRSGFAEGEFIVQDISSQRLIADVSDEVRKSLPSRSRALDLCAAPGGKSIGLLWSGFRVVASDTAGERLHLLEKTRARVGSDQLEVISSSELKLEKTGQFDLVWVDAPCTGSGIVRRHPDIRWLKKESDVESLAAIQRDLITKGASFVKSGGYLAFTVCSVFKAEGEGHLKELQTYGRLVRTWLLSPQDSGGDGFWGCLVQKT